MVQWLPVEEFDFDLERFADAQITFAKPYDTTAPVDRATELVEDGDSVRILAFGSAPQVVEAAWKATVHGARTHETIFADDTVNELSADPDYRKWLSELARSERGAMLRYPGSVSFNIALIDGGTGFALIDEYGAPSALIETDDEVILSWAESTIDAYREVAEPLDSGDLST